MEGRHREIVALRVWEMSRARTIPEYNAERDAAVLASLDEFIAFSIKYDVRFSTRESAEIAQHKMRSAIVTLPKEVKLASIEWLVSRGYTSWHGDK